MENDELQQRTESVEDGADPLDDVFGAFRRRLTEAQGPDAIAEQHYLMGVAYGRVGRYGEAKAALVTAADSERYRFLAAAMLGRIYRDEGNAVDAIVWFERAAAVIAPTPDEGWTVLYHLGTSLDARDGRVGACVGRVPGVAGDGWHLRDVDQRVARLTTTLLGG